MKRTIVLGCMLLVIPAATLSAETLQPETLKAWDKYVEAAHSRMIDLLGPKGQLPWIDQKPDRSLKLRQGQVLVAPMGSHTPKRIASGLIHDWIAAVFIPDAKIDDVLALVRDYGQYKDLYKPIIIDSKPLSHAAGKDEYSVLLLDKTLLSNMALDCNFKSSYRQLDSRRWFNIAYTTRVQEIEDYGEPDERELPADQGSGYIWRLYKMEGFEERDGGVYMEIETIALSRDIPVLLRWVLDPVVRLAAKHSLLAYLQDTRNGVHLALEAKNNTVKRSLVSALAVKRPD